MKNSNKALFLDRDGVINIDHGYVHTQENFNFIEGIFELVQAARNNNYKIIIVTNQAGIGRGYYSEDEFYKLMSWLKTKLHYDKYYFCPYHPEHGLGEYKKSSEDRKPNAGMLVKAQNDFQLDMQTSIMVGDRETDIQAAEKAGIGKKILLNANAEKTKADFVIQDLKQAIGLL